MVFQTASPYKVIVAFVPESLYRLLRPRLIIAVNIKSRICIRDPVVDDLDVVQRNIYGIRNMVFLEYLLVPDIHEGGLRCRPRDIYGLIKCYFLSSIS